MLGPRGDTLESRFSKRFKHHRNGGCSNSHRLLCNIRGWRCSRIPYRHLICSIGGWGLTGADWELSGSCWWTSKSELWLLENAWAGWRYARAGPNPVSLDIWSPSGGILQIFETRVGGYSRCLRSEWGDTPDWKTLPRASPLHYSTLQQTCTGSHIKRSLFCRTSRHRATKR